VRARDAALPPQARAALLSNFAKSAHSGAAVGSGSSHFSVPPGTPHSLVVEIGRIASEAFSYGYVSAMHQTMIMPIAILGLTALSCLFVKNTKPGGRPAEAKSAQQRPVAEAPSGTEASQAPAA